MMARRLVLVLASVVLVAAPAMAQPSLYPPALRCTVDGQYAQWSLAQSRWVCVSTVASTTAAVTNDATTNATMYPVWVTANTGSLPLKVASTKLSFNPSTGTLTSTAFAGALTGNVTGNVATLTGTTSDSSASALVVHDSTGANLATVRNDGVTTFGVAQQPLTTPIPLAFYETGAINSFTMQRNDAGENRMSLISTGAGVIDYPTYYAFRRHYTISGGTPTWTPMQANDVIGAYAFRGTRNASGSTNTQTGAGLLAWASETWSDTANGMRYILRNVITGTTTQWAGFQQESTIGNAFSGATTNDTGIALQVTDFGGSGGSLGTQRFAVLNNGTVKTAAVWSSPASSVLTISSNTVAPTGTVHHLGAGLVKTITVPATCSPTCEIAIVPDAAFTTDLTGNVGLASTATIGRVMTFVWDGTKWWPSY
jgi:hypothetical protein